MKDTVIGVDLAKTVFQIYAASLTGELLFRKKVRRPQFLQFMASQPPALVVMEACGSALTWQKQLAAECIGYRLNIRQRFFVQIGCRQLGSCGNERARTAGGDARFIGNADDKSALATQAGTECPSLGLLWDLGLVDRLRVAGNHRFLVGRYDVDFDDAVRRADAVGIGRVGGRVEP